MVNTAQRALDAASQTALGNIKANADILRGLGLPSETVSKLEQMATHHAESLGR